MGFVSIIETPTEGAKPSHAVWEQSRVITCYTCKCTADDLAIHFARVVLGTLLLLTGYS
jgi:hypothetical protein